MFQEMYLYEIILLILGVILFVVLLGGLILFIVRKQAINQTYLASFLLPILMISYPSVQRFSFLNDLVVLERTTKELEDNPNNEEIRAELKQHVKEVEQRPIETPDHLAKVAEAKFWLENYEEAEKYIEKAQDKNPENKTVQKVQKLLMDPKMKERTRPNADNKEGQKEESSTTLDREVPTEQ